MSDIKCPDCGKPCSPKKCDSGLGPIEVWGAKSFDSQPYTGSDCCDAELEDADAWEADADRGDYEYDQQKDRELDGRG